MSATSVQLEAGGLLLPKTKVDTDATEQVVARTYRHPALGGRAVIRLASDRLGKAEDLAMEFLGFEAPQVSATIGVQQRRSLGFAAWALINDPDNARYALDLVKRMKKTARQAKSKPGHAWDAYAEMAKDLGRSARHFLPPFWEEVGRTFKDLGNQTYAGRALSKSLEAERVHALASDRARRRDVVLEFVLSGCLSGAALAEYSNDLRSQYSPEEAYTIFRDLCVRRTRGGMAPWATMPKDFIAMAKAAVLDGDQELEKWLEEVIDSPAMGRPPLQFWKTCSSHCKRIVGRSPAFAIAVLRHTRPEERYYGDSKLGPWFELIEEWGVLEYLWEDEHQGAPPLGEPIAAWFGRIVRDETPVPKRTLDMLDKLTPRLKKEKTPLPLSTAKRYGATVIDIDVLEACFVLGIKVDDPPEEYSVSFAGWLSANVDHRLRNQDIVESPKDERFKPAIFQAMDEALACRGGVMQRGYRQASLEQRAFPLAALTPHPSPSGRGAGGEGTGDRPGITELWRQHASGVIGELEGSGLASFEMALGRLGSTLWPDTLRLFPDLAERLKSLAPAAMLQRTLQAGVFDEYGWPAFEEAVAKNQLTIKTDHYNESNIYLTFPSIVVTDKVHAYVISGDGKFKKQELHLPKKCHLTSIVPVGDDLAVNCRDDKYQGLFYWASDPAQQHTSSNYYGYGNIVLRMAVALTDGSAFMGQQIVRPGDKEPPQSQTFLHDGERFWRLTNEWQQATGDNIWRIHEIEPQTGKLVRESVPAWFEETDGGKVEFTNSELLPAPPGAEDSPLGVKDGMLGWKTVKRGDGSVFGQGIDGRRWDKPLRNRSVEATPVGLLRQPGTKDYLLVTTHHHARVGHYWLWDPSGSTIVAVLQDFHSEYAHGQVTLLPLHFWHLLKARDVASSRKLRAIGQDQCAALFKAAAKDREQHKAPRRGGKDAAENPLTNLLPAVKALLPTAPERMAVGVARVIEKAERQSDAFATLQEKMSADSQKETKSSSLVVNQRSDMAAAHWGMQAFRTYGAEGEVSVSANLAAAAEFLKGKSKGGDLPRTDNLWFSMLEDLPLRSWQTLWRVTAQKMTQKDDSDVPWLEFLQLWHELGIAELPGQFDIMDGVPEGAKKTAWGAYDVQVSPGASFTIQNGEDRFIVMENEDYNTRIPYQILRYSTADKPSNPPGYQVQNVRKVKSKYDPKEVAAFLEAAKSSTALPLPTREELAEVAQNLGTSPAEIGLIWLGGLNMSTWQQNFLPAELRNALGMKTTEASAARQALSNLKGEVLTQLYEAVVAKGSAAPFAADRGPVLRSIESCWQAKMPKRLQLDAELQKRLSALGKTSRWRQVNHEELLSVASDPAKHPLLQPREFDIQVEKGRGHGSMTLGPKDKSEAVVSVELIRSIVQLVGLVHAETPAGHQARAEMPTLIKQTTKLLDSPQTLLDLRGVYLHEYGRRNPPKPAEWLNKHLGKTKAHAKDGTARFDDGLISAAALDSQHHVLIGFRPAKLKDKGDLARLQGILGIDTGEQYEGRSGETVPVITLIKSPGFQKLTKAILAKETPEGQWPQNPKHTAAAVVKGIQKKHKLGEDAAVLYAQVLALPDPTTANLGAWNGWTAAQLKKAAAELVKKKLVLEATRARAGRSIFLPGEWADLKAPWLPIENWKLSHLVELDLNAGEPCPAGGPMVLRPFEELFAAAWKRVLDGDAPRYEEVKRKRK